MGKRSGVPNLQLWSVLLCLLLLGCSQRQLLEQMTTPEDRALAIETIKQIHTSDLGGLESKVPPEIRGQVRTALPNMRAALPPARRRYARLVDAGRHELVAGQERISRIYLGYEISGGGQYALARMTIVRRGSSAVIEEMQVQRLDGSVDSLTSFSLQGKSARHYAVLALASLAVAATIAALIRVWRSGRFGWRWLWTLGCIVGFMRFSVDWSTGVLSFAPLYISLFSASAFKMALGPWVISFSIPALAIYVLVAKRGSRAACGSTARETEIS